MGHNKFEDIIDILRGKAPAGELPKQIAPWIPNKPKPSVNTFADKINTPKPMV